MTCNTCLYELWLTVLEYNPYHSHFSDKKVEFKHWTSGTTHCMHIIMDNWTRLNMHLKSPVLQLDPSRKS